jgi:hypothetical protein
MVWNQSPQEAECAAVTCGQESEVTGKTWSPAEDPKGEEGSASEPHSLGSFGAPSIGAVVTSAEPKPEKSPSWEDSHTLLFQ